jgi:3-oxoacyl-[acyl-carrier-protein] synthase-3
MPAAARQALERARLTPADIDLLVPHQANQRILEAASKALELPADAIYSNLGRYGNTSAASIPIALCEAAEEGAIQRDDVVVCVGFGAGLTWGATALRWSVPIPAAPPTFWGKARYRLLHGYAAARSLVRRFGRWLFSRGMRER